MRPTIAALALVLVIPVTIHAADREPAAEIQPRVEYHLKEATQLIEHFETLVSSDCPRLAGVAEWNAYVEREIDRVLLLAAHLEQAWAEAKRTGDDDVRRAAKAPRRRFEEAMQIADKLAICAQGYGKTFFAGTVYRRIERELPRRQAEIALPR
jgi:hypothetical protein